MILLWIFFLVLVGGVFGEDFAVDPAKLKTLGKIEKEFGEVLPILVDTIDIDKENPCKPLLTNYLQQVKDSAQTPQDNLLAGYKLIRRMVKTLLTDIVYTCWDSWTGDIDLLVNGIFDSYEVDFPTKNDLEAALLGILRVHFIHGLNASDLSYGILNGVNTGIKLDFDDALDLAKMAIKIGGDRLAYQWMMVAQRLDKSKDLSEYWEKVKKISGKKSLEGMHKDLGYAMQIYLPDYKHYFYHASCRAKIILPGDEQQQLFCFYEREAHPYFRINPVKTEMLQSDPLILQFYEFVGDETINVIKTRGQREMKRDRIGNDKGKEKMPGLRTSVSGWVDDSEAVEVENLSKKISYLSGLQVKSNRSGFQVTSYGWLGGYYDFHQDSLPGEESADALASFQIFLSDVSMGGNEGFPFARVAAQPIKGSAIMWNTLNSKGQIIRDTMHGSCPVLIGTKEVATRWISLKENVWTTPCPLDLHQ